MGGSSFSEQAEMELLQAAPRRGVIVHQGLDQPVVRTQPFREKGRVIAGDCQSAAFFRSIRCKCADDHMATWDKSPVHDPQISFLIGGVGQEVERGPVMPDSKALRRLPIQDVRHNPFNGRIVWQSCARLCERSGRKVQYGDPVEAPIQQTIHQPRRARADINDGSIAGCPRRGDQVERYLGTILEPARLGLLLLLVDMFPTLRFFCHGRFPYRSTRRSRSALVMTETEERLIAAAAIIGESKRPVTG